jgi:WD40 repeat protein
LANAHERLNAKKLVLSGIAHDFVQAGYAKQQRHRRTRILSVGGVIGLIILGIILFTFISVTNAEKLAEQSKNAANTQAALANTARDTAATAQAASTYAVNQQAIAQANAEAASTQEAIALKNADEAQRQSNIARSNLSRLLAKQALELLDAENLKEALLIGLEAYRTSNTFEALNSLRVGLEYSPYLYKTMRLQDISFGGISNNIAFDANGKLISAAWSHNLSIYSVDITSGEIRTLHEFYPGYMRDATFNSGGSLIALSTGGVPGIEIYNTMTGKPVGDRIQFENISPGNHRIAEKFMFSPDGQTIAAVLTDDSLVFWDLTTHELKYRIEDIAFSPLALYKDKKMIVLKKYKFLSMMDITSGLTNDSWVTFEHSPIIKNIALSPDQRTIALGVDLSPEEENLIILWDINEQREITIPVPKEVNRIWTTAYSSDSKLLAFADSSSTLWMVDLGQNGPVKLLMSPSFSLNGAISFTPDNQNLVVTNDSGDLMVVDVRPIHSIKRTIAKLEDVKVSAMAFNPNNSILYTRDEDDNVLGWDISTDRTVDSSNNELAVFPKPGPEMRWDCLSPTRGGCTASKIYLEDLAHGATQFNFGQGDVASLALSPDGKTLAVGILYDSNDAGRIHLIRTADGKQAELAGFGLETITTLAFSPDGKFLAAGNQKGDIALYDLTSNEGLYPDPKVGDQTRLALEFGFSTDGQLLASASGDGITLWDTGSMRALVELPVAFKPSPETSPNLVFSADKRWLAVRGETEVTLWNIDIENWQLRACQMAGRSFSDDEWETFFSDAPYQETCPSPTPKPEITPPP